MPVSSPSFQRRSGRRRRRRFRSLALAGDAQGLALARDGRCSRCACGSHARSRRSRPGSGQRVGRHDGRLRLEAPSRRPAAGLRLAGLRPLPASAGAQAWNSAVTPSSLKRAAMVPNTGISSVFWWNSSRLRWYCLRTSRSASSAPLRSNLLMATKSAKSSMSIFSSWLAAPNSGSSRRARHRRRARWRRRPGRCRRSRR